MRSLPKIAPFSVVFVLIAAGCGSPPPVKYYTLRASEAPITNTPAATASSKPVVLVAPFAIDEAYAGDRIAYTRGDHELEYDPYSCWAGPPARQVEVAVRDALLQSPLFSDVRQSAPLGDARGAADLVVTGRVVRLEEIDADEKWSAALELELYLLDGTSHAILARTRFAAVEPTKARNPREVAATVSTMIPRAVSELLGKSKPALEGWKRGS